ncbi:hypothetical protein [Marinicellulosiphila megalodicopiae]|uniref:hypothetical protein n=1 Tax=Marinicellulosiphila megalodicopiae TaxID=2724896 RepID=UPI003BAE98D2
MKIIMILNCMLLLGCQQLITKQELVPQRENTLVLSDENTKLIASISSGIVGLNLSLKDIYIAKDESKYSKLIKFRCTDNVSETRSNKTFEIVVSENNEYLGSFQWNRCLINSIAGNLGSIYFKGLGLIEIYESNEYENGMNAIRDVLDLNAKNISIGREFGSQAIVLTKLEVEYVHSGKSKLSFKAEGYLKDDINQRFELKTKMPFFINSLGVIVEQGEILLIGKDQKYILFNYDSGGNVSLFK